MGAACCVASREKTITNASNSDLVHRNIRHSPTWSFRWDHRGRVAGEETSMSWFSDAMSRNDGSESKLESAYVSEEGSPLENFRRRPSSQKSSVSSVTAGHVRTPASDRSVRRNASSMDASMDQSKELTESPTISYPSPAKLSGSFPSTSSLATSPLSPQGLVPQASPTPPRWPRHSPGHPLSRQASDCRIPGFRSPNSYTVAEERPVLPSWSNDSTRDSRGGSSDSWSMNAFSELMANSHRERWSFESEPFGFNREKMARAASSQVSTSSCADSQSCGICLKLLTERSLWSGQKIFVCSELSVVAVLMCGHAYHAECLERMTSEINKYDPSCPICTFGEQQTRKMCEKELKAEMELKARNRRSRSRVIDVDGDPVMFDRFKGSESQGSPKMGSSSSMKASSGTPFLKKHFSFGSKSSRAVPADNYAPRKKGLFWAKSSKI